MLVLEQIIRGQMSIDAFIQTLVDRDEAQRQLKDLPKVAITMGKAGNKPIYSFKHHEYPDLGDLFQACKLYSFAVGGTPYIHYEPSIYDTRVKNPYIQTGVYNEKRRYFEAGARHLPTYQGIDFHSSVMELLFHPKEYFTKTILPNALEFGQTFTLPGGSRSLFDVMSCVIVSNPEALFLYGKPTVPGNVKAEARDIMYAFVYDAYNPIRNKILNPSGSDIFATTEGVKTIITSSFADMVAEHNQKMIENNNPTLTYDSAMSVEDKKTLAGIMMIYKTASSANEVINFPPMVSFYTRLVEDGAMIVGGENVINPAYTSEASEFPLILSRSGISSIHKDFLDYYMTYLGVSKLRMKI